MFELLCSIITRYVARLREYSYMTDQKKQPVSEVSKMLNTAVTGIAGMVGDMKI